VGGAQAPGRVRHLAFLAAAVLVACAPVVNYDSPRGPGLIGAPPRPARAGEEVVRIVTLNTHYALDAHGVVDLLRTAPELRGADLIALQEMDETAVRRISRALSLNVVYFSGSLSPVTHRRFGPALLTPWPLERGWKVLLPHPGWFRGQRRIATGAIVRIDGRPVRVYSVHLEIAVRSTPDERRDQLRAVLADGAGWADPVVVAGDMNDPGVGAFMVENGYRWVTRDAGGTMGPFSLDHVFVRGGADHPAPRSGTVDTRGVSDHRAVWALLRLR
jgi:endonuclease/exonuclease/phosphatase family metal-dependent hydrolase